MITTPESVATLLRDADPETRRRAAQRIGEVAGEDAVALLTAALGDADWRVRKEAAAVAAAVEPRDQVIERLFVALHDRDDVGLRNAAVEALVALGRAAVPRAVLALASADADARKLIVELLGGAPDLAGTRALALALDDADENVRATAAEALGTAAVAGEEARQIAVGALTEALAGDEPLRQLAALHALGRLEAKLSWALLEPLTHHPLLRRHAIAAAGRSCEIHAIEALARATADRSLVVARDALIALAACLGPKPGDEAARALVVKSITAVRTEDRVRAFAREADDAALRGAALVVLGVLQHQDDVVELVRGLEARDVAARAELGLCWFGETAVPLLLAQGRRSPPAVRALTLSLVPSLVARADADTLAALREALLAAAPEVKSAAIHAVALTGSGVDLEVLAPFTSDPDPRVVASACTGLGLLASQYPAAARALAGAVASDARAAIVGCLLRAGIARPGADDPEARSADLNFLRGALDHDDVRVRRAAVDALAEIGGPLAGVVVARAVADEERDVVLAAVRALGRIGQAEPLLALLDGVRDPVVVAAALRALGEASPKEAFEAARPLLRSEDPLLAVSAVDAFGQLRGSRRDDGLFIALEHTDAAVVRSALAELARDPSARTLARVGLCLDHPSYEVRRFAAELLGGHDDPHVRTLVRARLDRETDPVVREALTGALAPPGGARQP